MQRFCTTAFYGELAVDRFPDGDRVGGSPGNAAYRLSKILNHQAFLVSAIGRDAEAEYLRQQLEPIGFDFTHIQNLPERRTGVMTITKVGADSHYVIERDRAYDYTAFHPSLADSLRSVDALSYSTLAMRTESGLATFRRVVDSCPRALKYYDMNLRKLCYTPQLLHELCGFADIVKLNDEELPLAANFLELEGNSIERMALSLAAKYGLRAVFVTCGAKGAWGLCGKERYYEAGYKVPVVDTTGAGDAFTAGSLAVMVSHHPDIVEAVRFGNRLGAATAMFKGGMPTEEFSDELLLGLNQLERVEI